MAESRSITTRACADRSPNRHRISAEDQHPLQDFHTFRAIEPRAHGPNNLIHISGIYVVVDDNDDRLT